MDKDATKVCAKALVTCRFHVCCSAQDSQILLSYNCHNNYVNQLSGFSNLHSLFYGTHIYTILNVR